MYLALHILHPQEFLVPTYDIDIVWHTHQVRTVGNTLLCNRQALLEIFAIPPIKFTLSLNFYPGIDSARLQVLMFNFTAA